VDATPTILAAVSGLILGLGLGFVLGRARVAAMARQIRQLEVRARATLVPVLERRADNLGVPKHERGFDEEDPLEAAMTLASAIDKKETAATLPFSDTLQINSSEIQAKKREREAAS
jgi:hypothetical protein